MAEGKTMPVRSATATASESGAPLTLGQAIATFFRHPSPIILGTLAAYAWLMRLDGGMPTVWDALLAAFIIGFWPMQEWLIHVYILHAKPFQIGPWTYDLLAARKHRAHHRDPFQLDLVFIPWQIVIGSVIFHLLFWPSVMPTKGLAYTGMAVFLTFAFLYEWVHFLTHTSYRPQGAFYRRLWVNHRLHHFRNENYWYGVSMLSGDQVMRTAPGKNDVPVSPTALTLGMPVEE